mgnify:CR=1 FL=1
MSYTKYAGGNTAYPLDAWLQAEEKVNAAVTAFAGGGQASATALTSTANIVTTVASANDSVKLPLAKKGMKVLVHNGHATNSMQVFGAGVDTINGVATGTGVAQAATKSALYYAVADGDGTAVGAWFRLLSA